ncbi:hypothetical protein [Rhizobium laguerreae]|uniref:hypothetical protein n=1 Tax=Rhizobium laguerreae TaxID=1076926 RepID=UPI001C91A890|nr:hypothetical protein [Rhizobium laguerreae]MBY3203480.1 hypothetical protein [Rhizobium laguerreae]
MPLHKADENDLPLFAVSSSELDFLTLIEADRPPPIAFKDRQALQRWADEEGLALSSIGRRNENDHVAIIRGKIVPFGQKEGLSYEQVWANINYERYRNAVKFKIKTTEDTLKTVDLYDSDHAVARTRLSKIWPDAWVNMLLVERSLNRSIGGLLEKDPITPEAGENHILVNVECILKLFLTRTAELTREQVPDYLKEAEKRFLSFPRVPLIRSCK